MRRRDRRAKSREIPEPRNSENPETGVPSAQKAPEWACWKDWPLGPDAAGPGKALTEELIEILEGRPFRHLGATGPYGSLREPW